MNPRSVSSAPITLVRIDSASSIPLYRQIYNDLRSAIVSGRLARNTQLPATRTLARDLAVSRQTVSLALEQLRAEGYIETRKRSGTFVSPTLPDDLLTFARTNTPSVVKRFPHSASRPPQSTQKPRGIRPFRPGLPALDAFPWDIWSRLVARHLRNAGHQFSTAPDPLGYPPLRATIAQYISAARGVVCSADQVIITNGAQHALELAAQVLIEPGSDVWIEDPCYLGVRTAFATAGAHLIPMPVDNDGLRVSEAIHYAPKASAAIVTPSHQYPLGATMTAARRLELLQWARSSRAWIIEDDYDSEFRYDGRPLASLQGLDDSGRVIYIGTFSKILFSTLRIGYLISPSPLVDAFAAARARTDFFGPSYEAPLAAFMEGGHFTRHIRRMRLLYKERRDALLAAIRETAPFSGITPGPSNAGMHVIGWLPEDLSDQEVANHASQVGLEVTPLSRYTFEYAKPGGLVLGFSGFPSEILKDSMITLARIVERLRGAT